MRGEMAPNPKVKAAYVAMRALGISEDRVKPVLKKLLRLYDKNWALIEEESYRALADAIFEDAEKKVADEKRKSHSEEEEEEAQMQELQRPLKRLRRRNQENEPVASPSNANIRIGGATLVQPKQEEEFHPPQHVPDERNKGKQPVLSNMLSLYERRNQSPQVKGLSSGRQSHGVLIKEANVDSGTSRLPKQKILVGNQLAVMRPKDEPFSEDIILDEAPLAIIHPEPSENGNRFTGKEKISGENGDAGFPAAHTEDHNCEPLDVPGKSATNLEIASSSLGEVKITLSCISTLGRSEFRMPNLDEVLKMMEAKCLQSYKILDPNFSVTKLMRDMCQSFVELGKDCNDSGDRTTDMGPLPDSFTEDAPSIEDDTNLPVPSVPSDGSSKSRQNVIIRGSAPNADSAELVRSGGSSKSRHSIENVIIHGSAPNVDSAEFVQSGGTDPNISTSTHCQATIGVQQSPLKGGDITNGEEGAHISWINDINNRGPPSFRYTPQNLVFRGAAVSLTLAQIADGNCCPCCTGDCLSSAVPCACANGGEYAYNVRGLVKQSFLDECIAITRDPKRRSHFQCQGCPLERSKGGATQACNGHLKRKFIKECWFKCGCNRRCGNRVVQRGINCRLQVFMTSEAKGWGLRTLDELPKGAFVCEYIGEILTNSEVKKRNMNITEGGKMYQVLLDSGWDTSSLKDDEALCLDTTRFANVARFINHRCSDANLIEIPVEVESPKHHYYHLAFFTTRKVQALEELTWDYGINFEWDDQSPSVFQCLCGSKFCRNRKNSGEYVDS